VATAETERAILDLAAPEVRATRTLAVRVTTTKITSATMRRHVQLPIPALAELSHTAAAMGLGTEEVEAAGAAPAEAAAVRLLPHAEGTRPPRELHPHMRTVETEVMVVTPSTGAFQRKIKGATVVTAAKAETADEPRQVARMAPQFLLKGGTAATEAQPAEVVPRAPFRGDRSPRQEETGMAETEVPEATEMRLVETGSTDPLEMLPQT
jgi:hypothetical protein